MMQLDLVDNIGLKLGAKASLREGKGGSANFFFAKLEGLEAFEGLAEGIDRLFTKEDAVFSVDDIIESAAGAVGDNRAAASEGFNWGDTKRLKRGEDITFSGLEIFLETLLVGEGDKLDEARFFSELDEIFMLRAFADDGEGDFKSETGRNSEVEAFPGDLARSGDETIALELGRGGDGGSLTFF